MHAEGGRQDVVEYATCKKSALDGVRRFAGGQEFLDMRCQGFEESGTGRRWEPEEAR